VKSNASTFLYFRSSESRFNLWPIRDEDTDVDIICWKDQIGFPGSQTAETLTTLFAHKIILYFLETRNQEIKDSSVVGSDQIWSAPHLGIHLQRWGQHWSSEFPELCQDYKAVGHPGIGFNLEVRRIGALALALALASASASAWQFPKYFLSWLLPVSKYFYELTKNPACHRHVVLKGVPNFEAETAFLKF
jgi:hypothetical protein